MRMHKLLAAALLVVSFDAVAADFHSGWRSDEVVLEGPIERGDCLKFADHVFHTGAHDLYTASPGGSVTEAVKIGKLVRALKLGTDAPDNSTVPRSRVAALHHLLNPTANYMCSSACFFVFVAGVPRQGGVSGYPIIGIHRPFLADLDLSTLAADQVLNIASRNRLFVETYLKEMGVQAKYADLMYSTPKDDIRWITQQEFEQDFYGVIPELKEWIDVRGKQLATDLESISAGLTSRPTGYDCK